jgi:flagellar hook-associated protein 2
MSTTSTTSVTTATNQSLLSMSGLASGINTSQIITEMMSINKVPQQQLTNQQTTEQTRLTAYQGLNSQMLAVGLAAADLSIPTGWQSFATTSSNPTAVTASAGSGTIGGNLTFSVTQLAAAGAIVSSGTVASTSAAVASGSDLLLSHASGLGFSAVAGTGLSTGAHTLTVNSDGTVSLDGGVGQAPVNGSVTLPGAGGTGSITATVGSALVAGTTTLNEVSTGSGSLADVVSAINAAGAGSTAAAVQTGPNAFKLQISSTTTGTAADLTLDPSAFTGAVGSMLVLTAGKDATVSVGTGPGAYTVTSPTNSITGVMPGVTLNLLAEGTGPVTIGATLDPAALATKVQDLVDKVNTVIASANSMTGYDPTGQTTGPLLGDLTAQHIPGILQQAITGLVAGATLGDGSSVGLGVNSDGTISFDKTKFTAAVQANPTAVVNLFVNGIGAAGTGIAQRIRAASDAASASKGAYLTAAIQGSQSQITTLSSEIAAWQPILDAQQTMLQTQFTNMETLLASLQSQGTSLSQALGQTAAAAAPKGTLSTSS